MEHDLGGGWHVIVEWSPKWAGWMGTLTETWEGCRSPYCDIHKGAK